MRLIAMRVPTDGCGRMCNMTFYAQLMASTGKAYEIEVSRLQVQ
jgi:hypothetical protein